jgi:hypothetical protein
MIMARSGFVSADSVWRKACAQRGKLLCRGAAFMPLQRSGQFDPGSAGVFDRVLYGFDENILSGREH